LKTRLEKKSAFRQGTGASLQGTGLGESPGVIEITNQGKKSRKSHPKKSGGGKSCRKKKRDFGQVEKRGEVVRKAKPQKEGRPALEGVLGWKGSLRKEFAKKKNRDAKLLQEGEKASAERTSMSRSEGGNLLTAEGKRTMEDRR